MKSHLPTLIHATLILLPLSTAQNTTNTNTTENCYNIQPLSSSTPNAPVNSTGSQSFRWTAEGSQDWHLTVTFNDTRSTQPHEQYLQGWLSTPADTNASVCTYVLQGLTPDARLQSGLGGGDGGCDGWVSEACRNRIVQGLARLPLFNDPEECPRFPDLSEFRELCGDQVVDSSIISTGNPKFLSNTTCEVSSPPGPNNISSSSYKTIPAQGFGMLPSQTDQDVGNFTWYDTYVTQTRPWVITEMTYENGEQVVRAKVVCVAPDQVVGDSRKPETQPDDEKGGAGQITVGLKIVVGVVVVVAAMAL